METIGIPDIHHPSGRHTQQLRLDIAEALSAGEVLIR